MAATLSYSLTHQGVRDLDNPLQQRQAETCSNQINVGPTERAASAFGGAVLTGIALGSGGWNGILLGCLGASLIYRGITGHCSAYAAADINTAQ
jgi:uncharacterized membrane protein